MLVNLRQNNPEYYLHCNLKQTKWNRSRLVDATLAEYTNYLND